MVLFSVTVCFSSYHTNQPVRQPAGKDAIVDHMRMKQVTPLPVQKDRRSDLPVLETRRGRNIHRYFGETLPNMVIASYRKGAMLEALAAAIFYYKWKDRRLLSTHVRFRNLASKRLIATRRAPGCYVPVMLL